MLAGVLFCGGEQGVVLNPRLDGLQAVLDLAWTHKLALRLYQAQLAGAGDRFGASLDLEFTKDFLIVPLHRVQSQKESLADPLIRESLRDQVKDFSLAGCEWLDQRLRRGKRAERVFACAPLFLSFKGG